MPASLQNSNSILELSVFCDSLLRSIDEPIVVLCTRFHIAAFNEAAAEDFRTVHGRQLVTGTPLLHLMSEKDQLLLEPDFQRALTGERIEKRRVFQLEGDRRVAYCTILRPLRHEGVIVGVIIHSKDVSSEYESGQRLRESHERFARAERASFDMIWEVNIPTGAAYHSERQHDLLGYDPAEVGDRDFFFNHIIHPSDREMILTAIQAMLSGTDTFADLPVHRLRRKNGVYVHVEVRLSITRDAFGNPLLLTGVTRDITQRRLDEMELQQLNKELQQRATELQHSIDRYDLVAKATSDVVWDWNLQTNQTWYGAILKSQFGYEPAEAAHDNAFCENHVHPEEREAVMQSVQAAIAGGQSQWQGEYRFLRADGSYAWVFDRGHILYDDAGKPLRMIGSMQDITRVRELQQQIVEEQVSLQKLVTEAAIRSQEEERALLGRELHDNINQILASCKLMTEASVQDSGVRDIFLPRTLRQLDMVIEEIRKLSRRLVSPALREIDLRGALSELVETGKTNDAQQCLFEVKGSVTPLRPEVSLMLYRVAQEQLHNIQKYAFATEVRVFLHYDEGLVRLIVSDNGCGFDPALRRPGIGLRNIRTRVELLDGVLNIDTRPGAGCRLSVAVPLTAVTEAH